MTYSFVLIRRTRGDDEEYTEQLWQEYAGWFSEKVEEKYDILRALRHDGLLKEEYIPDVSVEHTAGNLWREMLRFKACISRLDDAFFCLYFLRTGKGVFPDRMVRQCAERRCPAGNPDDNH